MATIILYKGDGFFGGLAVNTMIVMIVAVGRGLGGGFHGNSLQDGGGFLTAADTGNSQ